jgi:hypothetical protein
VHVRSAAEHSARLIGATHLPLSPRTRPDRGVAPASNTPRCRAPLGFSRITLLRRPFVPHQPLSLLVARGRCTVRHIFASSASRTEHSLVAKRTWSAVLSAYIWLDGRATCRTGT